MKSFIQHIVGTCLFVLVAYCPVQGQVFSIGMGGLTGSQQQAGGLDFRLGLQVPQPLRFTGNFGIHFPSHSQNKVTDYRTGWTTSNLNIHYNHNFTPEFQVAPFIGVNHTTVNVETSSETFINREYTNEESYKGTGMNVGVSLYYDFGRFVPFAEGKYVINDPALQQSVWTIGFIVEFGQTGKSTYQDNTDEDSES